MPAGLTRQAASWRATPASAPPLANGAPPGVYRRHRPETTALYEVVRDNLETLFGAIHDGALAVRIPRHARKELFAYLDCGLLCRGFARLKCHGCSETRLVAFSCKGREFCPSCMGLAAASPWRSRVTSPMPPTAETVEPEKRVRKSGYRPWAELLQRTFALDVLTCPSCKGRMRLLAVVKNPLSIARYLAAAGELTDVPSRAPGRGPPYWKSQVLQRQALGDVGQREASPKGDGGDLGSKGDEAA